MNLCKLIKEQKVLLRIIRRLQKSIVNEPSETLLCSSSHRTCQFIKKTQSNERLYISKNDQTTLKTLGQQYYEKRALKTAEEQYEVVSNFLDKYDSTAVGNVFEVLPEELKKVVFPVVLSVEEKVRRWKNEHYVQSTYKPEAKKFKTLKGDFVRSKSEALIANMLFEMGIAYRYECRLEITDTFCIYPDFTILNTRTGEILYLEHFGMMDDAEYANAFIKRLKTYKEAEIYPGRELICSFESKDTPLDLEYLKEYLKECFDLY